MTDKLPIRNQTLNDSYYFMGAIQENQYFSNLIDQVGIIHDSRDLNLILSELPHEPKRQMIMKLLESGLVTPILDEMAYLNEALEGNKPLSSITAFPAMQALVKYLADPVTIYESTLLPILKNDVSSVLLTEPVKNDLLQKHDSQTSKDSINRLYEAIGGVSFAQIIYDNASALDYVLSNVKLEKQTVYGQVFISTLSELVTIALSLNVDEPYVTLGKISYNVIDSATNRLHAIMTEKKMITTPASSKSYMLILASLRRHAPDIVFYDGASLDSATEIIKNFKDTGSEIALNTNTIVNRHAGLIMMTAETGGGKTSAAEAMRLMTGKYANNPSTFDRVHLSEPNRPALLGTEGTNEAIEYALHSDADVIVIDSMSHIPVNYAKGQALTSKGVSWNVREIFMALGILCMAHGKTIVVVLNVESAQKSIYSDLFKGIAYINYTKEGTAQNYWDITVRSADSRIREEYTISDREVFGILNDETTDQSSGIDGRTWNSGLDPYFRNLDIDSILDEDNDTNY